MDVHVLWALPVLPKLTQVAFQSSETHQKEIERNTSAMIATRKNAKLHILASKELPNEEWRNIPGWEGYYEASNLGRIRSVGRIVKRKNGVEYPLVGRVLNAIPYSNGYLYVTLCVDGQQKNIAIHRLIALAFYGDLPDGCEVHHKDEDKTNNRLDNLECMDGKEHLRMHVRGEGSSFSVLTEAKVKAICMLIACGQEDARIAQLYGVTPSAIRHIRSGKTWKHVTQEFDTSRKWLGPLPPFDTKKAVRQLSINWGALISRN